MGDEQIPEQEHEHEVPDPLGWVAALVVCTVAAIALRWLAALPATTREDDELLLLIILPFVILMSYRKRWRWLRKQLYARAPKG